MESVKDEFQGFGEDFTGFPKRLPDDCVEYTLFVIDSKLTLQKDLLARLETVRKESVKLADGLLKDYIWQRDGFRLEVESRKDKGMMHLHGLTNYGDSVEDEWLIVYILKELTNRFPDLWVRVVDSDGEFLLIEAANALPRWLNPEIAENRVWIHQDKLHIVPLTAVTSSSNSPTAPISRSLGLDEALKTVSHSPHVLIHSPMVEAEAFYRLRNYPSQINNSLHYAIISIPRRLAYILHDRPASIAPAVESFYLRDPISLKTLQTASSLLTFQPKDLVAVSVRFTKVLYAQLKSQQFPPPFAWKDLLSPSEGKSLSGAAKKDIQLEMGMKVTSGFEMLLSDPKNDDKRVVREIKIILDDLGADNDADLPSDAEILTWKDVGREDDEKWLDINFEDFERELDGKARGKGTGVFGAGSPSGFGDAKTQADLKKMVERFEAFMNDENAGADGAEMDDMDFDDDDEGEEDEDDSEDEDKDVRFDENEFARMMREMMGMPPEEIAPDEASRQNVKTGNRIQEADSDEEQEESEVSELRKVMQRMEAELNEEGALNLDPTSRKVAALKDKENQEKAEETDDDEETDEEINIDFNLAKNLLESFKSQAGMAGPGGNLMGMMGMQLPRDEDDTKPERGNN